MCRNGKIANQTHKDNVEENYCEYEPPDIILENRDSHAVCRKRETRHFTDCSEKNAMYNKGLSCATAKA